MLFVADRLARGGVGAGNFGNPEHRANLVHVTDDHISEFLHIAFLVRTLDTTDNERGLAERFSLNRRV